MKNMFPSGLPDAAVVRPIYDKAFAHARTLLLKDDVNDRERDLIMRLLNRGASTISVPIELGSSEGLKVLMEIMSLERVKIGDVLGAGHASVHFPVPTRITNTVLNSLTDKQAGTMAEHLIYEAWESANDQWETLQTVSEDPEEGSEISLKNLRSRLMRLYNSIKTRSLPVRP